MQTNLGDIDIILLPDAAPRTVQNFLTYVNRGDYTNTFFHRLVPGFVLQGGGFRFNNNQVQAIRQDAAVPNEFRVSNTRGTLAMARIGGQPNSATNQFFFNLRNNSLENNDSGTNLDAVDGGFTVFARVANQASLATMDRIASLQLAGAGAAQPDAPLLAGQTSFNNESVIRITGFVQTNLPAITNIIAPSGFGGLAQAAPGGWLEIYGSGLGGAGRGWTQADFDANNGLAPSVLDETSVTVADVPAFVSYASNNQVNVQVPTGAGVPQSGAARVVVSYKGVTSASGFVQIRPTAPGLLAVPQFNVNGRQYVTALRGDNTFITNGQIAGIPGRPAAPGETIVLYGVGFGSVSPLGTVIGGRPAPAGTSLNNPVTFRFGESTTAIRPAFAGLVAGAIGLYQFNVTLPADLPSGDVQLTTLINNTATAQQLWLPVQRP